MLTNELTGEKISSDELKAIALLAEKQIQLEMNIETTQEVLNQQLAQLKQLSETIIPEQMMAMGLSEFKLASGEAVTIKKFYSASISPMCANEAMSWLRKSGNDDIIKNNIICQFGKGEDDMAAMTVELLRQKGLHPEQKTFVHPMTLKSFVKERIETAQELPQELFGVFIGNKTTITKKK